MTLLARFRLPPFNTAQRRATVDGDAPQTEESATKAEALATKQKKGHKLVSAGRGARGSKVHNTKKAMKDDVYSHAGAE